MNDVIDDRTGQHQARDPVPFHPRELHADDRQKGRKEQREHRSGHHPVEHPRHERMAFDLFRKVPVLGFERGGFSFAPLAMGGQNHVTRVGDEKHEPGKQRGPHQAPRNVREDGLPPGIASPRQEIHSCPQIDSGLQALGFWQA